MYLRDRGASAEVWDQALAAREADKKAAAEKAEALQQHLAGFPAEIAGCEVNKITGEVTFAGGNYLCNIHIGDTIKSAAEKIKEALAYI